MSYLVRADEFWHCQIVGKQTIITIGKLGTEGKKAVKDHVSELEASNYMGKQRNLRMQKGFVPKPYKPAPGPALAGKKRKADAVTVSADPPPKRAKAQAKAVVQPKAKAKASGGRKRGGFSVDSRVPGHAGMAVVGDHSVTLNQTNIGGGANNNKFYIIQALQSSGGFFAWNRWGRVGDEGQTKLMACSTQVDAIREFEKKFKEKTANSWDARAAFVKKPGKYTLVETEDAAGGQQEAPMGKLTEAQIGKGQSVLDKLRSAQKGRGDPAKIEELSSQYYSLIPHDFGWKKPPSIASLDMLEKESELLKFYMRMGFEKVDSDKSLSPISGVMELPCPKSLDEAARGVCASSAVASSNSKGRELASKQSGKPKKKMDAHLYAAIMLYTSNAIYAALNKCLRDSDRAKVKKYFKYLRLLLEAMDCLPKQRRTLWRGISVDLYSNPEYSVGKTVTWWGISSCTSDQKVAQGFAQGCGSGCTLVTVLSTSACDISAISFFGNEKESLLRPGCQLKVKSRAKKGNVTEITLQEVGCAID